MTVHATNDGGMATMAMMVDHRLERYCPGWSSNVAIGTTRMAERKVATRALGLEI